MRSRDRRYNNNNGPPLPCHGSRLRGVVIDTLLLSRRTAFAKHALKVSRRWLVLLLRVTETRRALEECTTGWISFFQHLANHSPTSKDMQSILVVQTD